MIIYYDWTGGTTATDYYNDPFWEYAVAVIKEQVDEVVGKILDIIVCLFSPVVFKCNFIVDMVRGVIIVRARGPPF